MPCPYCNTPTEVKETRTRKNGTVRRTRVCVQAHKFTTEETVFLSTYGAPRTRPPLRQHTLDQASRREAVAAALKRGTDYAEIAKTTGASVRTVQRMARRQHA